MKRFAVVGVGGYVAPRHLRAIKECGGNVLCAIDKHDSVGVMDSYFPHTHFLRSLSVLIAILTNFIVKEKG